MIPHNRDCPLVGSNVSGDWHQVHTATDDAATRRYPPALGDTSRSWYRYSSAVLASLCAAALVYATVTASLPASIRSRTSSSRHDALVTTLLHYTSLQPERSAEHDALMTSGTPISATMIDDIVHKTHDALKQQRFSLKDPLTSEVPPQVAENLNFSTSPCDNFYDGNWIKGARIPADSSEISRTWDGTQETVDNQLREIMTFDWPEDSAFRRINDAYSACMDVEAVEVLGSSPLQPMLQRIDSLASVQDLQSLIPELVLDMGGRLMFSMHVSLGFRNKNSNSLFIGAAGLTMPDASWYDTFAPRNREAQERVLDYLMSMNKIAGSTPEEAHTISQRTLEAEAMLAQWNLDEPWIEDPLGPELTSLSDLEALCPSIQWRRIFDIFAKGCASYNQTCCEGLLNDDKLIIMTAPHFFQQVSAALGNETLLETFWKPYIRSHYIISFSSALSKDFLSAANRLDAWAVGVTSETSREHKCTHDVKDALSALTDRAYLELFFPAPSQAIGWSMLTLIKESFLQRLNNETWLDEETREKALEKAAKLGLHLGGSEIYKEFRYELSRHSFFNNTRNAVHCRIFRSFTELGLAPDARVWIIPSYEVNAYYDQGLNALFIPAGILQPPFFSPSAPLEQNFGAIGMIMAHEMTHGFDNKGSRIDDEGELKEWWSQPVREKFMKRASCIRRLYDNFEIAGKKVKGGRSLGEDIADMGGLGIAYSAYRLWYNMTYYTVRSSKGVLSVRHRSDILPFNDNKIMSEEGQNDENMTMDNEPPEAGKRLFFIAFGQNWCAKTRRENVLNNEVNSDHAPWPFRCNGVVSQMEDFSQVFHCPVGSPMHPYNRCVMWREIEDGHRGLGLTGLQATNSRMHLKARIGRLSGPQPAWDF